MSLPVLDLSGTPYEQGRQHGEVLRDRIAHNLAVYFDRFERETKLSRAEVLRRAALYRAAIAEQSPDYHDGMRGVADGSGFPLDEIAALNVRYEILYYQFGTLAMEEESLSGAATRQEPDGCTSFAVLPEASANGHLLLGQNWDWIPQVKGAILRTGGNGVGEPAVVAFTEAGIVGGKIGLNSAGLGLCINGMTTTDDDWSRLRKPFHVRCYEVLRSRRFEDAVRVVTEPERACSTNFLIAQAPDRVVDIEAAPGKIRTLSCEGGSLVHTNHFLDPHGMGIQEAPSKHRPQSYHRRRRLAELMERPVRLDGLKAALRDHEDNPFGLCRHEDWTEPPEEHYITVASVLMDLHDRRMWITDGPPCKGEYEEVMSSE